MDLGDEILQQNPLVERRRWWNPTKILAAKTMLFQLSYIIAGSIICYYLINVRHCMNLLLITPALIISNSIVTLIKVLLLPCASAICRQRLRGTTYLFYIVTYICFIFNSEDACDSQKLIYYYCMIYILVELFSLLIMVSLLLLVIRCGAYCCCPLVLLDTVQDMPIRLGASDEDLNHLTEYTYHVDEHNVRTFININDSTDVTTITEQDNDECQICIEPYTNGCAIRYLQCGHYYHKNCCDRWLQVNPSCPLCRGSITLSNAP